MSAMAHADHEEVFAAYLAAEARGEGGDFEALCREHAAIAPELRALYADWRRVQGVLARIHCIPAKRSKRHSAKSTVSAGVLRP